MDGAESEECRCRVKGRATFFANSGPVRSRQVRKNCSLGIFRIVRPELKKVARDSNKRIDRASRTCDDRGSIVGNLRSASVGLNAATNLPMIDTNLLMIDTNLLMIEWFPALGVRNLGWAIGVCWLHRSSGSSPCPSVFRGVSLEEALTHRSSRANGKSNLYDSALFLRRLAPTSS